MDLIQILPTPFVTPIKLMDMNFYLIMFWDIGWIMFRKLKDPLNQFGMWF
jgi:hypothetical protein